MVPGNTLSQEGNLNLINLKKLKKSIFRENLVYRANEYKYSFKKLLTVNL